METGSGVVFPHSTPDPFSCLWEAPPNEVLQVTAPAELVLRRVQSLQRAAVTCNTSFGSSPVPAAIGEEP